VVNAEFNFRRERKSACWRDQKGGLGASEFEMWVWTTQFSITKVYVSSLSLTFHGKTIRCRSRFHSCREEHFIFYSQNSAAALL